MIAWDGWVTMLPPLVAIGVALALRRVVVALASGAVVAAVVAREGALLGGGGLRGEVSCLWGAEAPAGVACALWGYLATALFNLDNLSITTFTCLVAGTVGIMGASGATSRLVAGVERLARGPRGAMLASWAAGFLVFFDDYANCMVVGRSMGPVCDRQGVSRAKLAYIVDCTAAPLASVAVIGTWVGYEVGLIEDALRRLGRDGAGFATFVSSLPYAFYAVAALALVGAVASSGRDIGPMLAEERRARAEHRDTGAGHAAPSGARGSAWSAALPVVVMVGTTLLAMVVSGVSASGRPLWDLAVFELLAEADALRAMLLGSAVGFALAAVQGRRIGLRGVGRGAVSGLHGLGEALVVLYLAWTLGDAINDTAAQDFLTGSLRGNLSPALLPAVVFGVGAATAFATGSAFGTMGLLVPLVVPLSFGLDGGALLAPSIAAVLGGACLGDHASPISDTTVLSAAGCEVDVVTHVRTQLPYVLIAGAGALLLGFLPAGFGVSPWVLLPLIVLAMALTLRLLGRTVDAERQRLLSHR